jgi:hypothetical protein
VTKKKQVKIARVRTRLTKLHFFARKTLSSCTHYGKSEHKKKYPSAIIYSSLPTHNAVEQDITRKVALPSSRTQETVHGTCRGTQKTTTDNTQSEKSGDLHASAAFLDNTFTANLSSAGKSLERFTSSIVAPPHIPYVAKTISSIPVLWQTNRWYYRHASYATRKGTASAIFYKGR